MEDRATLADQGTSGTSTPPDRKQQDQKSSIAASAGSSEDKKATKNRKAQQRYRLRQKEKKENIQQQLQLLNRKAYIYGAGAPKPLRKTSHSTAPRAICRPESRLS